MGFFDKTFTRENMRDNSLHNKKQLVSIIVNKSTVVLFFIKRDSKKYNTINTIIAL